MWMRYATRTCSAQLPIALPSASVAPRESSRWSAPTGMPWIEKVALRPSAVQVSSSARPATMIWRPRPASGSLKTAARVPPSSTSAPDSTADLSGVCSETSRGTIVVVKRQVAGIRKGVDAGPVAARVSDLERVLAHQRDVLQPEVLLWQLLGGVEAAGDPALAAAGGAGAGPAQPLAVKGRDGAVVPGDGQAVGGAV